MKTKTKKVDHVANTKKLLDKIKFPTRYLLLAWDITDGSLAIIDVCANENELLQTLNFAVKVDSWLNTQRYSYSYIVLKKVK